jgi:hypothetical protein
MIYFGYGANKDPEMIEAIIGRRPSGFAAGLADYQLCIQRWEEIPKNVQDELRGNWSEVDDFATYFIRPAAGFEVTGWAWSITDTERRRIDTWEMNDGFWYKTLTVGKVYDLVTRRECVASTEVIMDSAAGVPVKDPHDYPPFLADKTKMLRIATRLREKIDSLDSQHVL